MPSSQLAKGKTLMVDLKRDYNAKTTLDGGRFYVLFVFLGERYEYYMYIHCLIFKVLIE